MKEMWSRSVSGPKSVVSYVLNIRERLTSMTDLVKDCVGICYHSKLTLVRAHTLRGM